MQILFLSTWFPYPPDNGSKIRVYHLLRSLNERHEVDLLSFAFGTAMPTAAALNTFCRTVQFVACDPHHRHSLARSLRFFSPTPLATQPVREMLLLVRHLAQQRSYDAVIASTKGTAVYALDVPAPVRILEEHNSGNRQMRERYEQAVGPLSRLRCWVSWQKTRRYETAVFPNFGLITMVSQADRAATLEILQPHQQTSVEIVPNGVDCQQNRPHWGSSKENTLIFNGALTYSANYDAMRYFLAEIYPLIKQGAPDVRLRITGSLQNVDLTALALDESVELLGYVEDIRPVVTESAVCVVPIRMGGGTRLKILEAMALGVPVVSTTKGAEGLTTNHQQHLLLADSPAEFATSVLELIANPLKRQQLAVAARHFVELHYDWSEIGRAFLKLIESCDAMKSPDGLR